MEALIWPIQQLNPHAMPLPQHMRTRSPYTADGALDLTTALLLPAEGTEQDAQASIETTDPNICLGLWMGSPFSIAPQTKPPERNKACCWVTNFPATTTYGDRFAGQLEEIGLGQKRELQQLKHFRTVGCRTLFAMAPSKVPIGGKSLDVDGVLIISRSAADLNTITETYVQDLRAAIPDDGILLLHGGPDRHLPRDPTALGFDGLLDMPTN